MRLAAWLPILALLMLAQTQDAAAQSCSFSNTGIDFGNVSLGGGFQTANGTFAANCTGTPGQTIRICANFNAGSGGAASSGDPRYLSQGATQMSYNIYRTNGVGQIWGSHTWSASARPPAITISLNGSGNGNVSHTMFGRLSNQQGTLPTGTFSSVFSGANTRIDYGYAPGFNCGPTLSSRVQSVPFTVRTTNNSACTITATDLNFGNQANLNASILARNSIQVNCTAGTLYEVGLGNGTSGATAPSGRRMTNIATAGTIAYGIFRDNARSQQWGSSSGVNTMSGVGTGTSQVFTGYGLVPVQPTPGAYTYTDTIIVQVTY